MKKRTFLGAGAWAWRMPLVASLVLASCFVWAELTWSKPLTLTEALSRALAADFGVAATRARIRAAEAGVRQADRLLNPSVGVEVENFGGSGAYRGFRSPETTFFLQQTIELGGKRTARKGVARSEIAITRARGAVQVLDLLREVEVAWIEIAAATAQARVAEDRLVTAKQLLDEINRRARAGRDPLFTQSRAEAQVALEQIAVDQAREAARIARANLAGYWRGGADFDIDLNSFEGAVTASAGKVFDADVAVLEAERKRAVARVDVERSRAVPDPAVRVGVRHFSDTRDSALIAGLSIPIPIFDNNSDNIEKAEAERRATELEIASSRKAIRREVERLQSRLAASLTEARRIQSEVIPKAERAVRLISEGLQRGAFSYVEFVDAQRTLNDAHLRRIAALKSFHVDQAALGRLTGRHARLSPRKGGHR